MTDETKILFEQLADAINANQVEFNRIVEAINSPDWWTIGITAVNAVIMVWLGWKQYKLQKQQNKIQEYQTELQKQQTIAQQRQTEALDYEIYRRLYLLLSKANAEIEGFIFNIHDTFWEPNYNIDKDYLSRKKIEIDKLKEDLKEGYIDYELKFSKEVLDIDGYINILGVMSNILFKTIRSISNNEVSFYQMQHIECDQNKKDEAFVRAIISCLKNKEAQYILANNFAEFIEQKRNLAINEKLISEIRNRCKIQ